MCSARNTLDLGQIQVTEHHSSSISRSHSFYIFSFLLTIFVLGFFPVSETDEDVITALEYGVQEVFGAVPGIIYRIVNSQKKNDDGTHYEITASCKTESKSICRVVIFKVLDRYGELFLESYDTLLDGTC